MDYIMAKSIAEQLEILKNYNLGLPPERSKRIKLNFGKYKGLYLHQVPEHYLKWLHSESDNEKLLEAIEEELEHRC